MEDFKSFVDLLNYVENVSKVPRNNIKLLFNYEKNCIVDTREFYHFSITSYTDGVVNSSSPNKLIFKDYNVSIVSGNDSKLRPQKIYIIIKKEPGDDTSVDKQILSKISNFVKNVYLDELV